MHPQYWLIPYRSKGKEDRAARREPRSLEAAGTRCLWVSRKSDWGGSRAKAN